MSYIERSIKYALDLNTGEILDADEVFDKVNDPFKFREEFNRNKHNICCLECKKRLIVSNSSWDNLHFRHEPKSGACLLKISGLSTEEIARINNIGYAKESDRHKFLKNAIYSKLLTVPGVDPTSVTNDDTVISRGTEKRRPDVYCKYLDKEIVFEIQLSALSHKYILSRHDFYKENGIYLIWILDNFDVEGQTQTEQDIKYLEKHHNFFRFDESADEFRLMCKFKYPYIKDEYNTWSKWMDKSVRLKQLHFDPTDYKAYYFDYGNQYAKREDQRKRNLQFKEEQKRKKELQEKLTSAENKANEIIAEIGLLRLYKSWTFNKVAESIDRLDSYEIQILNSILDLPNKTHNNEPALNHWIRTATKDDISFINFILNSHKINLDVNKANPNGITLLQQVYKNEFLYKPTCAKLLFKRGYLYTEADDQYLNSLPGIDNTLNDTRIIYRACNLITDKSFIDNLYEHDNLIYIIESAKSDTIIHYNLTWIAFANNAIQSYPHYWTYIRAAFKHYNLWGKLLELDKKKTFQTKVENWEMQGPAQKLDFDNVFGYLYPEVLLNEHIPA